MKYTAYKVLPSQTLLFSLIEIYQIKYIKNKITQK